MARFLFTVWPFPTHLDPFIALANALRGRGHEAAFYSGGEGGAVLSREGYRCYPFEEVDWRRVAETVDDLIAGRRRPSQMRRLWPKFLVETARGQVRDIERILAQWPADALICDIAMWGPILVLHERLGIPVIPFSHVANCILPGPERPVPGVALPGGGRGLARMLGRALAAGAELVTARTRREANALRREFNLPPLHVSVNAYTGSMPLYLVPGAPEFDNHRGDLPRPVHYVGPCLWDKHQGQAAPPWLATVPTGRPCVVVDEGALFTPEPRLLELAARGLADLPLTVILLAGHGRDPAGLKLGRLPDNVTLHAHAPLSEVLPKAKVLVTNGNTESVLNGLQAGLPVVVVPSLWDQAEMAWRVQETGVGLRLAPRRPRPKDLQGAVLRVLNERSFGLNVAAMQAAFARYGGPQHAAELIEQAIATAVPNGIFST